MKQLSREDLLQKSTPRVEKVIFDDADFVYVREMSGRERDRWEQSILQTQQGEDGEVTMNPALNDFRAKLAVCTLCDEHGVLLLRPEDTPILSTNMPAAKLELIINAAQKLNRISKKDRKALVKNSEAALSGNSTLS